MIEPNPIGSIQSSKAWQSSMAVGVFLFFPVSFAFIESAHLGKSRWRLRRHTPFRLTPDA